MNHRKRTFAALMALLGSFSAANAQLQPQPPGYGGGGAPYGVSAYGPPAGGYGAAGPYGAGMAPAPLGAPSGPAAGGAMGGYGPGGPASPQEALYNYYTQGAAGPGDPGVTPPGKLPPDPFGPQRLHMPLPERNDDFAGGNERNIHTRPDEKTIGPRLDSSYTFFREAEAGVYMSEHQQVGAVALSFLPLQTPCWLIGARAGLSYNGNGGIVDDQIGATTDVFWGTRFGHNYFKLGYFVDWDKDFRKHGFEVGWLTKLGPLGNVTFEGAFDTGEGADKFINQTDIGIFNRAEIAKHEEQIRVGKFLSPYFQTGLVGEWANFRTVRDEFGGGLFANWFYGRTTLSAEATAGTSGFRGFLVLGFNWGGAANIDSHPIDPYFDNPIDTISWVTRAPRRDITLKVRESQTGPGPDQSVPVFLNQP